MAECIVTGIIYKAGSNTPWAYAPLRLALKLPFAAANTYPLHSYDIVTGPDGSFSVALATPASGTATYTVTLPDGSTKVTFYVAAGTASMTLQGIVDGAYSVPADPGTVAALIAAHAAIKASAGALGHIRIGSGLAIDADGIVSAAGGGGGVSAHGALTGLGADDHTQYLTQARGDARYYTEAEVIALLAAKANTAHASSHASGGGDPLTLAQSQVTSLVSDLAAKVASVTGTAPITSSGGTTPAISISAATSAAPGSMSAADKALLTRITTVQALTDGAVIAWDVANSNTATLTIGGNRTLANPTNLVNGASYVLRVTQDGTGSRTLAYGSAFKWAGGTAPTLSTAAGAIDVLTFLSDGTSLYGSILKAFS